MQTAGFVERHPDPKDRRAWRLHLTPRARAVIDDMQDIGRGLRKDATAGISAEELAQALAVIGRIKDNLQSLEQSENGGE